MNTPLKTLFWCFALTLVRLHADPWTPPPALLDIIRHIESANGQLTVGDNGRSLGDYQLSEAAWLDVNAWRKVRGLAVYSYQQHVWNRGVSRAYAAQYLRILHSHLESRLKRPPSWGELYAAYNMGLTSFADCQYRVARSNPATARKCQIVQAAQNRN
jgi:hypothetical protein